ncbi:ATP-binding protein [Shewanella indica]|uniref:ATP-binding protein n=1 Tax=Shewanella indica TaxID=768528 RepID=UPI003999730F
MRNSEQAAIPTSAFKSIRRPKKLETRLIIWVVGVCVFQALFFFALVYNVTTQNFHQEVGGKALALAMSIASRPDVIMALKAEKEANEHPELNAKMEQLRQQVNADFIVIGNTEKIRLVHPEPTRIGQRMVGEDSEAGLRGEYYVSEATGSLGESIRGKVPVYDHNGEVLGLVSVGFLAGSVELLILERSSILIWGCISLLLFSIFAAIFIGRWVRNAIFGLQPDEIARLFAEQEAILNTVRSGIIALDPNGNVRKINQRACEILEQPLRIQHQSLHLSDLLPEHAEFLLRNPSRRILGFELFAADKRLVLSRFLLQAHGYNDGVLLSMRPADELEYLSQQLAKVQAFGELLRVQTHDYSNKLNTIGALIQMGELDKAIELIGQESQGSQAQIESLLTHIQEPVIAGLLLGKYHKAREVNVCVELNNDSLLCSIERKELLERMVSILGNLIDNAIEAVQKVQHMRVPRVLVTIDETAQNIIFDVEDSGIGLGADKAAIFTPQYSSKTGAQHGVGLYLVKTHLESCGGTLELGESDLGGARITVYIPKKHVKGTSHGVFSNHC